MSSSTITSSKEDEGAGGVLTIAIFATVVFCLALAFSFAGTIEWSNGGSFIGPTREILEPVLGGPQQVIEPYQCKSYSFAADEWHPDGQSSPRDWIWGIKLVLIGGWYLGGGIILAMLVGSIILSAFKPKFWDKADVAIGVCLIAWLLYGFALTMPAMLLTSRQASQCI